MLRDGTPLRDEHHRQPGHEPHSAPPPPALPGILHVVLLPAGNGDPLAAWHGRWKGHGNVSNGRLFFLACSAWTDCDAHLHMSDTMAGFFFVCVVLLTFLSLKKRMLITF